MSKQSLKQLRARAIAHALAPCRDLRQYMHRTGFVQADPIRSPARAEDLILRQRVSGYRCGDLIEAYGDLRLEEGYLYAYGFVTDDVWQAIYPLHCKRLTDFEKRVLACVEDSGQACSDELDAAVGRRRVRNGWGGQSKASRRALEQLQRHGLLRVAGRSNGVRVYETAARQPGTRSRKERFTHLAGQVAGLLAPAPRPRLQAVLSTIARRLMGPRAGAATARDTITAMLKSGALCEADFDGITYVWPQDDDPSDEVPSGVRLLAPFDPLVWDRWRFEHFWDWAYRFEAYTPPAKRVRGYYALPLLRRDAIIGWANAEVRDCVLHVEPGFIGAAPNSKAFRREMQAEADRLAAFLRLDEPNAQVLQP